MLVVAQGKRLADWIARRFYAVRQIKGVALGYEIHDQPTTDLERLRKRRPDFQGYPVDTRPAHVLQGSSGGYGRSAGARQSASGACGSSRQRTLAGGAALCTGNVGAGCGRFPPPPICAASSRSGVI